jgi:hypothetical protein
MKAKANGNTRTRLRGGVSWRGGLFYYLQINADDVFRE